MKCRGSQPVMRTMMVRALSFSAVAAMTFNQALTPVLASDYRVAAPVAADGQMNARFLALGIGKSVVIDLPRDIKDVLVADPKIANAVVRSAQRAYIIGAAVGQTNIVFFDSAGQQIAAYDIAVKRDLNGLRAALKSTLPNADIQIEGLGDGVMLTGSAASPIEAQQAGELAARLVGRRRKGGQFDHGPRPRPGDAEGHVAEVQRSIIKQLGIDLSANLNYGTAVVKFNNNNPFTANGCTARPRQRPYRVVRRDAVGPGDAARDGKRRCRADAGRTQSDSDLRRVRDIYLRRRISNSDRRDLPTDSGGRYRTMRPDGQLQEIRHLAQLHAGGADRGADQPAGDDRSVGSLDRKRFDWRCRRNDDSFDQDPPRGNHAGNSIGRRDGDGRPDPGTDQAGHQRICRASRSCRCSERCSAAATSSTTRPN